MSTHLRDDFWLPDDWYDPREDECPDCGRDIPSGWCRCRMIDGRMIVGGYDNGDRSEDIESGLVHGDGGERTYLNDNDGE
jgi:hypothetical protein